MDKRNHSSFYLVLLFVLAGAYLGLYVVFVRPSSEFVGNNGFWAEIAPRYANNPSMNAVLRPIFAPVHRLDVHYHRKRWEVDLCQ